MPIATSPLIVPKYVHANRLGDPTQTQDHKLSQFIFIREYKVDMRLFRHLMGAVTHAGYVKPTLSYELTPAVAFKVAHLTSGGSRDVASPGNSRRSTRAALRRG